MVPLHLHGFNKGFVQETLSDRQIRHISCELCSDLIIIFSLQYLKLVISCFSSSRLISLTLNLILPNFMISPFSKITPPPWIKCYIEDATNHNLFPFS